LLFLLFCSISIFVDDPSVPRVNFGLDLDLSLAGSQPGATTSDSLPF
jgi:hypothetical protein